jgi:hypothetical protein
VAGERIGVPPSVASLDVGERRLGDERAEAHVVGLLLEEHELLLGDGQLGANPLEAFADVDEATLQDRARHRPECTTGFGGGAPRVRRRTWIAVKAHHCTGR